MSNELTTLPSSPAALHRAMAQMPAVLATLDRFEAQIFQASTSKTFAEYGFGELIQDFSQTLDKVYADICYTEKGNRKDFILRLIDIVKKYYPELTMRDFRLAFELTITGDLDPYFPKNRDGSADRNHYQQFGTEYVCKVLNAYKQRRAEVLAKANDALPAKSNRDPQREAENAKIIRENLLAAYEYYKENSRLLEMSPIAEMLYHEALAGIGLAKHIEVTPAEQQAVLNRAVMRFAWKGYTADAARLKKKGIEAEEIQHDAFSLARRKALRAAFQYIKENDINLSELL